MSTLSVKKNIVKGGQCENEGINKLIDLFNNRISGIVNCSLKRFIESIRQHPDFEDEEIPFLQEDRERAEKASEKLEKIVLSSGLEHQSQRVYHRQKILLNDVN